MEILENKEIKNGISYNDYKSIVFKLAEESKSSGESTEERIAATLMNAQRIKRIDKQCEIKIELKAVIDTISEKYLWVLITESWCGDGAQCIPVIAKMASLSDNIELSLIFRDENLDIIDSFLTNGSRSIPKLICFKKIDATVIGTWGPRPKAIQNMVSKYKNNNPNVSHDEFVKNLHLWYARDKTNALQNEFVDLIKEWVEDI
jgi:hypothetical protein